MQTYIAILRGINVGGKNKIPMMELRSILTDIGLRQVRTYIQSGNIVFQAVESNASELADKVTRAIHDRWKYEVSALVLDKQQLTEIIEANPFADSSDVSSQHITFLAETPDQQLIDTLSEIQDPPNDIWTNHSAVYLFCPNGYSKTKFTNTYIEKKLKVAATTRNMKTSLVLLQMAQ